MYSAPRYESRDPPKDKADTDLFRAMNGTSCSCIISPRSTRVQRELSALRHSSVGSIRSSASFLLSIYSRGADGLIGSHR